MSRINPVVSQPKDAGHLNWMGGVSYDVTNPVHRLRMIAASSFFGEPKYYGGGDKPRRDGASLTTQQVEYLRKVLDAQDPREWRAWTPAQTMEHAIDEALDANAEATLMLAGELRNEWNIRVAPQVILVRAANHAGVRGTGLVRKYAPQIIKRADEPATGLAYQLATYGKDAPIPNALKKAWRAALEGFSAYQLAKYRMDGHTVKAVDVVRLVHAKGEAISALVKGTLKNEDTWEAMLSADGNKPEVWRAALPKMGHMALLRNLRNLSGAGLDVNEYIGQLIEGARNGKQLPFRYWSAYRALVDGKGGAVSPALLDGIETAMVESLKAFSFPGRVMSLCDNSGSARGAMVSEFGNVAVNEIANLTGVLVGARADEGYVGVFGDRLQPMPVRKLASLMDQAKVANQYGDQVGGATENGVWLFFDNALRTKERWDTVFIFSDMQAGHGGLYGTSSADYEQYVWQGARYERYIDVAKLIRTYHEKVNPDCIFFLVQVAGYGDTLVPEYYRNCYILGGWGGGLLPFAAEIVKQRRQSKQVPA